MEQVYIDGTVQFVGILEWIIHETQVNSDKLVMIPAATKGILSGSVERFRALGLTGTANGTDRLLKAACRPLVTWTGLLRYADYVRTVLKDELNGKLFLYLDLQEAHCYQKPLEGLDDVIDKDKFPSTSFDLDEASKCIGLGRYTAAVFHSMRVAEVGLRALARYLGITTIGKHNKPIERANWNELIESIESAIKPGGSATLSKDDQQFCSEAAVHFRYFKDAWRNDVMHVRQMFDEERGRMTWEHMKSFMHHLATKLKRVRRAMQDGGRG